MGLKSWLFKEETPTPSTIRFGRFTDLYKPKEKYEAWDNALIAYNDDLAAQSYLHFMDYIKNEGGQNIEVIDEDPNSLKFYFLQGSKKAYCHVDEDYFHAEVKIASCAEPNLTVFRSILEENYRLRYTKFCLDENHNLTLVFQTNHLDANPYKLYYGLKELATIADHKDDALIKSFDEFDYIDNDHINPIPSYLITAKFEYFKKELELLKKRINALNLATNDNLGDLVYLIAAFAYKMDCLLLPEGMLMQRLENLIDLSNNQISKPDLKGINAIINELEALDKKTEDDFQYEFYQSEYTFGLSEPIDHNHIINIIDSNLEQLRYYVSQKNDVMANTVCTYVFGKIMYEFSPPKFDRDMIQLFFQITEPLYFSTVGATGMVKKGNINKSATIRQIEEIEASGKESIKGLHFDVDLIMWDKSSFGPSFIFMMLQSLKHR